MSIFGVAGVPTNYKGKFKNSSIYANISRTRWKSKTQIKLRENIDTRQ